MIIDTMLNQLMKFLPISENNTEVFIWPKHSKTLISFTILNDYQFYMQISKKIQ